MFIKRFLLSLLIVVIVISIACYATENAGFSIIGFSFSSKDFSNPMTIIAILVISAFFSIFISLGNPSAVGKGFLFLIIILVVGFIFMQQREATQGGYDSKTSKKEKEITTQKEETKQVRKDDVIHFSQPLIWGLTDGGTIDATCDDGYKISIVDHPYNGGNTLLIFNYTFSTKEEYLDAVDYINRKGGRWIINNQSRLESNIHAFEQKHYSYMDEKNGYTMVEEMNLTSIAME